MASILETQIKKLIGAGFKGKLLKGTLRRTTGGTLNDLGDVTGATSTDYPFEGIRDTFDRRYATQANIPLTDVRILIIADLIQTQPQVGDLIQIRGRWHKVRGLLGIDPANASYTLQCYETEQP